MCDREAISREHVPPLCLFPTAKDLVHDFRQGLITVPSCDLHNSLKSRDDEFLMVSLAGIFGNNSIGYKHRFTKVDRALRRSANRLLDQVVIKKKFVRSIQLKNNSFIDVIWGTPDIERLRVCFNHIAMGLHRHHFGRNFEGKIQLLFGYLFHDEPNARTWVKFIQDRSEIDLKDQPKIGKNPEVFYYQITDYDEHGLFMVKLCFYGGLDVYVAFLPSASNPPANLVTLLMDAGIHTVLTLGDKNYEFNLKIDS